MSLQRILFVASVFCKIILKNNSYNFFDPRSLKQLCKIDLSVLFAEESFY
jgi:hypothetical protein